MTVRNAELMMAVVLAVVSVLLMIKSAELNIGWVPDEGPGAGAWPFWLSAGMLLSCMAIVARWFARKTPESNSTERYVSKTSARFVGITVAALTIMLLLTQFIGIYISLVLFMFFFIRIMGGHSMSLSIILAVAVPVVVFLFFEWALTIPLPKGISEPLFYPIYDLMY